MKRNGKLMKWRDTVKLFQMAGSDRRGQCKLAEGMRMGRWEEMRSSREKAFASQMMINSESYHRVDEEPLEENAEKLCA